jgi:hypothetical protein
MSQIAMYVSEMRMHHFQSDLLDGDEAPATITQVGT